MAAVGPMNTPIWLERPTGERDALGNREPEWQPFFQTWADVETVGASEPYIADRVGPQATLLIRTRWYPGVDSTMRIIMRTPGGTDRVLQIVGVLNENEQNAMLLIQAVEQLP